LGFVFAKELEQNIPFVSCSRTDSPKKESTLALISPLPCCLPYQNVMFIICSRSASPEMNQHLYESAPSPSLQYRLCHSNPYSHNTFIRYSSPPFPYSNSPLNILPPSAAFFAFIINGTSTIINIPTTNDTKIMVILIFLHLICFLKSLLFF